MKKIIVFALVLVISVNFSCKKNKSIEIVTCSISDEKVQVTYNSASISGSYVSSETVENMALVYDTTQNMESICYAPCTLNGKWFSVEISDLTIGTKYYYCFELSTKYGLTRTDVKSFQTLAAIAPKVLTGNISAITSTSAVCKDSGALDCGSAITERGICWSVFENPTICNDHTANGSGTGSFTSTITSLTPNTTYYVRAYAVNEVGITYGKQVCFTTIGTHSGYDYIDLGLPSGLMWATCNVGTQNPEGLGDYFAWGEITPKYTQWYYNWSNYRWCEGTDNTLTKYNTDWSLGTVDNKTVLELDDDAANANWGGNWRMPTHEEMMELHDNCTWTWTSQNGINGCRVTGPNGNSIFLPAAGFIGYPTAQGDYWSSSLITTHPSGAHNLFFASSYIYDSGIPRTNGLSVRPVYSMQDINTPTVKTSIVSNITQTTAVCGGNITSDGGAPVTARGICWSTSLNPTTSNSHTIDGSGTGTFTSSITGLMAYTSYYVRAYATNSAGTAYGSNLNFTTESSSSGDAHGYIDLGLPSGLLWATCNIGAKNPEDYGDYFSWAETTTKSNYNWNTYMWCNGSFTTLTKYCTEPKYGYNGFVDDKTVLEISDDAAHANWSDDWRIPTVDEWQELYDNTSIAWTTQNGVYGRRFTSTVPGYTNLSLFFPAAGYRTVELLEAGSKGLYWSSSLYTSDPVAASDMKFDSYSVFLNAHYRFWGLPVRPVRSSK